MNSETKLRRKYGPRNAAKIQQRLHELDRARNLADIGSLPAPGCHELSGGRKGHLAVELHGGWRMTFRPVDDPVPTLASGGLDWGRVTAVEILSIEDYHRG